MALLKKLPPYIIPSRLTQEDHGTVDISETCQLQSYLDSLVGRLGVLGLQVSLKNREGRFWHGAGGSKDLKRRFLLKNDHIVRIASTTKLFTSVAVLNLVDSGVIDLEDTLSRFLPDFPRSEHITVAMLLSHTSGIGHPPFTLKVKLRLLFSKKPFVFEELVNLAALAEPYDVPGGSHQYSNANYHLLGAIVERVYDRSIVDLMKTAIFEKLGLTNTFLLPYESPPENLISGFDNVYTPSLRFFEVKPSDTMLSSHASTSGGMVSTARDLLTFIDGLFAQKLLSSALWKKVTDIKPCTQPDFHHTGYGLGLFRIQVGDIPYLGHLGLFVGSQALVLYQPQNDTAIAAVGNLSDSRIFEVVESFSQFLR